MLYHSIISCSTFCHYLMFINCSMEDLNHICGTKILLSDLTFNNLWQVDLFPWKISLQGTSKQPCGRSCEYCFWGMNDTEIVSQEKAACTWHNPWDMTNNHISLHYCHCIRITGDSMLSFTLKLFPLDKAPNILHTSVQSLNINICIVGMGRAS